MNRYQHKLVSFLVVFLLLSSMLAGQPQASAAKTVSGRVPVNVVGSLAIWFIANDIHQNPGSTWNASTRISKITTLYDENELPSGYAFELQTGSTESGYIIGSAFNNLNPIQEFAYSGKPLFYHNAEEFDRV